MAVHSGCKSMGGSDRYLLVWDLARALDAIFVTESQCFAVVADVPGDLPPRCGPADPECGPVPICDSANHYDPTCCTVGVFDPVIAPVPTLDPSSPIYGVEQPQTPGECSHHGECIVSGGGNQCVAYTAQTLPAICPCYSVLRDSSCGCVGGECLWFEQQ